MWRGRPEDPAWVRPTLVGLLALTALAYTWSLDSSGYGNEYYAAAAYSGSQSWTAWLFGSFDSASFISVDKPPSSLWVTGLSVRAFGLSSWSILLPQAVAGVASVGIVYGTVRRWKGPAAGLLSGLALATTPIAVVMFRYNNPDALLTLLLVAAVAVAYGAVEKGSGIRLSLSGVLIGLAFLTKTTQALLVLPAIGIAYLLCAPVSLGRRLAHGVGAMGAAVVSAGWWILLAETSPAAPFFGQTRSGSFLDYVLGQNGLDRISGASPGPGGTDPFGGSGGWGRLFNTEVGDQISWLIPLAIAGMVAAVVMARREDRSGWILWSGVLITHLTVFSLMAGVFHPYYSLSMAPAIAALAGAGAVDMWRANREGTRGWWLLPLAVASAGAWAWVLLDRVPEFMPLLGPAVGVAGAIGAVALLWPRRPFPAQPVLAIGVLCAMLVAPLAYGMSSIGVDFSGGDPTAGPAESGQPSPLSTPADSSRPLPPPPGDGGRPYPPPRDAGERYPVPYLPPGQAEDRPTGDAPARPSGGPQRGGRGITGPVSESLIEFLVESHEGETWLVATRGTRPAATIILATGEPVMAMGGFSGGDPTPTSTELVEYITAGRLRFVMVGGDDPLVAEVLERCAVVSPSEYGGQTGVVLYDCISLETVTATE